MSGFEAELMQYEQGSQTDSEKSLMALGATTMEKAESLTVTTDKEYEWAGEWLKDIKFAQKRAKDFYEPMRKATKAAYDKVVEQKNLIVKPLEAAEKIVKDKMGGFYMLKEAERRKQEELLIKQAEKEAKKLENQAEKLEAEGELVGAAVKRAEASLVAQNVVLQGNKPTVNGISTRKSYRIVKITEEVPVTLNGVLLRPVDERAVMKLIKDTEGKVKIPGVEFVEDVVFAARS